MQTIEQIPPKTEEQASYTDEELASLALAETQLQPARIEQPRCSIGRTIFWTVVIIGTLIIGVGALVLPVFARAC